MNYLITITLLCSLSLCNLLCNVEQDQVIIDTFTQHDLDLLSETDRNSLAKTIPTVTTAGKRAAEPFLLHPTASTKTLRQRQAVIHFFLEQETLHTDLEELRNRLPLHEDALAIEKEKLSLEALKQVYFSWDSLKRFNTSPYALDIGYLLHIAGLCFPMGEYLMLHSGFTNFAPATPAADDLDDLDDHAASTCGHNHLPPNATRFQYYRFHAALLAVHIPAFIDMGRNINQRAATIKILQQQMIHLAEYTKTARVLYELLKSHHADTLGFAPYHELEKFFSRSPECSLAAQDLLKLLNQSTFTGQASFFSHIGGILAAYNLYMQTHQEFENLINALGEIELYIAAATMIKKQTVDAPWCFVEYSTSTKPHIHAKNLRHLFIPAEQSRNWDNDQDYLHTFITGENGSGKSTYINGIGHALIFAQTFGIAPAQEFEITPFSHICTYRFIQDDIAAGTSRFYAECARIEKILNTITENPGLSCVLLDEPFTSTNAQKGSDFLEVALSKLYEKNNVISFTASHYTALSALAIKHTKTHHLHLP